MKLKNEILKCLLLIVGLVLFSACGKSQEKKNETESQTRNLSKSLNGIWNIKNGDEKEGKREIILIISNHKYIVAVAK